MADGVHRFHGALRVVQVPRLAYDRAPIAMKDNLISHRFAIIVISILLGASAAGWVLSELLPLDLPERLPHFEAHLGETVTKIVLSLRLYDPFHSFWYRAVLALFFIVLLLCIVTRWSRFLRGMFKVPMPSGAADLDKRDPKIEVAFGGSRSGTVSESSDPSDGYEVPIDTVLRFLRRRGYSVRQSGDGKRLFSAVKGRWRFVGNFLFHLGILAITAGGMVGSFWGGTAYVYGRAGDLLPLPGSTDSVLVRDFRLLTTEEGEIRDYISTLSIIGEGGDTLVTGEIEVNKPLGHEDLDIFQSSYYVLENEFEWARVGIESRGGSPRVLELRPGAIYDVEGTGLSIRATRFLPDFRMGERGPYSAGASMGNPALEIEVTGTDRSERGWLFLNYPRFNSKFDYPVRALLLDIGPVMVTGLQVSCNPGEHVLLLGIALATLGLLLLYSLSYRVLGGYADSERLVIAALSYKWRFSMTDELKRIGVGLERELGGSGGDSEKDNGG
jgi:cytochrome c biogenesis protein